MKFITGQTYKEIIRYKCQIFFLNEQLTHFILFNIGKYCYSKQAIKILFHNISNDVSDGKLVYYFNCILNKMCIYSNCINIQLCH